MMLMSNESHKVYDNQSSNQLKKKEVVLLSHGAGGSLQDHLIKFITNGAKHRKIDNGIGLDAFDDGATIPIKDSELEIVVTSDGHAINPIFFPGGDIGLLAATGTINDLLMMGATPIAITSSVFLEEGLEFDILKQIFDSFNLVLERNNIALLCGDTKVLPKGNIDKIIMSTTGIGFKPRNRLILDSNVQPGDKIIVTGTIGDHGAAIIAKRNEINLETDLKSDVIELTDLFKNISNFNTIHAMKDPTRGGLSAALNEWAHKSNVSIILEEDKIPIKKEVVAICEILGLNPMEITNEGKAIISVKKENAEQVLTEIKKSELGRDAAIIGEVSPDNKGKVFMKTRFGGLKFINMPMGEPIPRVC